MAGVTGVTGVVLGMWDTRSRVLTSLTAGDATEADARLMVRTSDIEVAWLSLVSVVVKETAGMYGMTRGEAGEN